MLSSFRCILGRLPEGFDGVFRSPVVRVVPNEIKAEAQTQRLVHVPSLSTARHIQQDADPVRTCQDLFVQIVVGQTRRNRIQVRKTGDQWIGGGFREESLEEIAAIGRRVVGEEGSQSGLNRRDCLFNCNLRAVFNLWYLLVTS